MKIVIFGPERRLGALAGDCVIDLNRGLARYLKQSGDRNPDAGDVRRFWSSDAKRFRQALVLDVSDPFNSA
jgi:hypothetical protein